MALQEGHGKTNETINCCFFFFFSCRIAEKWCDYGGVGSCSEGVLLEGEQGVGKAGAGLEGTGWVVCPAGTWTVLVMML